ncbi:reverse transcriptase domain-containing protein [Tanacetum coccineum]
MFRENPNFSPFHSHDLRTMKELHKPSLISGGGLIAPTTVPETDFVLKNHMVQLLRQNCQFHGFKDEDANEHLDKYLSITQFIKQNGVSQDIINLNLFPFSLTHEAESWFYRLKTHSIHTWEEMVSKFLSKYYPYSKALQLRKDILNFWQLPAESVFEAWERFKSCLRKCPDHRILLVDQILTFYHGITMIDREKIMMAAGGDEEIELNSHEDIDDFVPIPRVSEKPLDSRDPISKTFDMTITNPLFDFDSEFTLNSDNPIFDIQNEESDESETETIMEEVFVFARRISYDREDLLLLLLLLRRWNEIRRLPWTMCTFQVQKVPYVSHLRLNKDMLQTKFDIQIHIVIGNLLTNKEKLLELANTPLNENCSAVLLKKLHEKLGDPRKFLIPCDFSELKECLALADLGANINLMPPSVWKKLMLPELIPTRMTLELANRSVAYSVGIVEDVFVQVGKFMFPADFIVVDYDIDPRVPLILGRPFLRKARALVDVHGEELTLRVGDERLTFNKSIHPLSGSPTPSADPVVASLSPSLSPFGDSDFLLEETDAFLALDDLIPPEIDNEIYDSEGDILFLENLLNDDPTKDLPPKELKND